MNLYEFNLLITSSLGEEKLTSFCENLISEFKKFGDIKGNIDSKQRKLAYPINKESEAWLTVFFFSIIEEDKKLALNNIEKVLKEKKEILRYLILAKKETSNKVKEKSKKKDAPEEANLEKVNQKVEELLKEE